MGDRLDVINEYKDTFFRRTEGEIGVRNLNDLCETLGYGQGYMRNRAIEEMLADNPGAVEAVADFLFNWSIHNTEWNNALREAVESEGVLEDE